VGPIAQYSRPTKFMSGYRYHGSTYKQRPNAMTFTILATVSFNFTYFVIAICTLIYRAQMG